MKYKKRVRSLLRVSSRQQLHDDDIPIQRAEIASYISSQPEWEFDCEYIEKAVSAFKNTVQDREVLLQILEDAREKKFDILLTFMSDRIGRLEEYSMYIATLNKLGIEVWTIKEGKLSTKDDTDRLMLYIKFWGNERESRKTGERVRAAQCEMVKQGRRIGGKAPYGYEMVYSGEISNHGRALKKLQIVESEAAVMREIYRLSAEENLGSYSIAKRLNEQGILSNGHEWKACTVSDRMKNPIYMGYLTYNRRSHEETYRKNPQEAWVCSEKPLPELQIVSPALWHKAQQRREQRRESFAAGKEKYAVTTSGRLALMGLAYCASCGTRLTNGSRYDSWILKDGSRVKKMSRRYKCTKKANASAQCRGLALYKADEIESLVFTEVCRYLSCLRRGNIYEEVRKSLEESQKAIYQQMQGIQREYENVKADIKALEDNIPKALAGRGLFSAERLSALLHEKEGEQVEIKERLEQKRIEYEEAVCPGREAQEIPEVIPDWEQAFRETEMHLKKVILGKLIERIEVGREEIRITFTISEEAYFS